MTVMATPPSDDTRTLFKLLVDGEWHTYQDVRDALAKTVPPGRALRKYSERYKQNRKGYGDQPSPLSEDEQIKFGQSACAQITITSWKGRGIQHRVVEGTKQIRVDPNYQGWGVMLPGGLKGGETAGGSPEVPPADSEPSTPGPTVPDGPSEAEPIPPPSDPAVPAPVKPDASAPVVRAVREAATGEFVPAEPSPTVTKREGKTCEECGLLISDQGRHDAWHLRRAKELERPDMALLDKEAMVTLLGDVMGQELAAFQKGMQGWLMQQFTQLALVMGASQPTPPWLSGNPQRSTHRSQ